MSADIYSCLLGRKSRIKEEFKVKTCRNRQKVTKIPRFVEEK